MTHTRLIFGLLPLVALAGCYHKTATSAVVGQGGSSDGPGNAAVMAAARRKAPVLDRALTSNDLNSLKQFMDNYRATAGKYPANMNELKQAMGNEGQKLYQLIEEGVLVMTWNTGDQGVLAYDKRATVSDGMVLTVNGIERMGANDLNRLLR
jgi:hypothetical protein